jgi:hypothetical protein
MVIAVIDSVLVNVTDWVGPVRIFQFTMANLMVQRNNQYTPHYVVGRVLWDAFCETSPDNIIILNVSKFPGYFLGPTIAMVLYESLSLRMPHFWQQTFAYSSCRIQMNNEKQ